MHVVVPDHRTSRGVLAVLVVTAALGVLATGVIHAAPASADPTPSCDATTCTVGFGAAGTTQQWNVPAGVSTITVTMAGGSGGSSTAGGARRSRRRDGGHRAGVLGGEPLDPPRARPRIPAATSVAGARRAGPGDRSRPVGGAAGDRSCSRPIRLQRCCSRWAEAGAPVATPARSRVRAGATAQARMRPPTFVPTVVGLGGTLAAGGAGGAGNLGPIVRRVGRRRTGHGAQQPRHRRQWRCFGFRHRP